MLTLKKIQSDASWGKVVDDINGNNGAIVTAVEMSKFANVDWGDEVAFPIVNAISSSATLQHNTCYLFGEVEELNITLDSDKTPLVKVYMFQFHSGATPTRLSVPSDIEWAHNPIIRANRVYQVTIIDGYATYREFLFNTADIPTTEIWYTSLDGNVVEPNATNVFGATYESSIYEKDKGIMSFDGEVTSVGANAFMNKTTLTSVTLPDSIINIGNYAFRGCSSLVKVHIPDSVTSIGTYAFSESAISSITIPNNVTSIIARTFSYCQNLTTVEMSKNVTAIGNYAFDRCYLLVDIEFPQVLESIGDAAFYQCRKLATIDIPNGVTKISDDAFNGCSSVTSVTIGNRVTSIGRWAFENCTSLTSITIPDSVTSIENYAFRYCSKLTSVTFEGTKPPTIGTNVFTGTHASLQLKVPMAAVDAYKTAWSDLASKIVGY